MEISQLENKVYLRTAKVGFPEGFPARSTASLYQDRIEIKKPKSNDVLTLALREITKASYKEGAFSLKANFIEFYVGEQYYSLDFRSMLQMTFGGLFGVVGVIFGSKAGSGRKIAKTWALALEQNDVQF